MTFFNFQQDDGNQQFQVSNRWWYFLAATIPLTVLVFMVWIVWQKVRARRFEREDLLERRRGEMFEQPSFGKEYEEEGFVPVREDGKKRGTSSGIVLRFMRKRNQ
jgi:flagellar biosynthesis/type III secretory pathway M-ring protein FliF/YscJ